MIEQNTVIKLIENGVSPRISKARAYAEEINTNVTGKGVKEVLEILSDHENPHQKKIREKIVKSNKSLFSFLTRPIDKVFTAKGGYINYNLSESEKERVKTSLLSINNGLSIKEYLKKKIKLNYVIDPNGFLMVDLDSDGVVSLDFFGSKDLLWYDNSGNNLNAVIFDFYESGDSEDKKKYYRVIDELTDSIYVKDGDNVYQDESSIKDNYLGYVSGYILGDICDVNEDLFLSVVDDVLEDAVEHLRDVSVSTVHKLSHGYAKYWSYPESCTTCGGSGSIKSTFKDIDSGEETCQESTCHTCGGGGVKNKKDASDLMMINIPEGDEKILAPDVAGYINPSIEIWKQYNEDIQSIKSRMFQCLWGSTFSVDTKNETATGRLLNVQPEAERVSGISETFSNIHNFVLDALVQLILLKKGHETNVSYGTRYLMESPDVILNTYQEAVKDRLHSSVQTYLLDRFFQTEHSNNPLEYSKINKIIAVDPFPTSTVSELKDIGVSNEDIKTKVYYPQWVNSLTDDKKLLMTVEELKTDLKTFINSKTIENVTKEV